MAHDMPVEPRIYLAGQDVFFANESKARRRGACVADYDCEVGSADLGGVSAGRGELGSSYKCRRV
jgi:hypothetical protein